MRAGAVLVSTRMRGCPESWRDSMGVLRARAGAPATRCSTALSTTRLPGPVTGNDAALNPRV